MQRQYSYAQRAGDVLLLLRGLLVQPKPEE
jgi:hypothetical protein